MTDKTDFTQGEILKPLLRFVWPVFCAMFLQSMYAAVDLLIVGRFSGAVEASATATGAHCLMSLMTLVSAFAMGTTIYVGQAIGRGERYLLPHILGAVFFGFLIAGLVLSVFIPAISSVMVSIMQTPTEAHESAVSYLSVCGFGALVLVFYNIFGAIFRGMGDSKTPLIAVSIACISNIFLDLFFVAYLGLGAKGAAIATVIAQTVSVLISYLFARRNPAIAAVGREEIQFDKEIIKSVVVLGSPLALQDILVSISFLTVFGIINGFGVAASAGGGIAGRICGFIMLVPGAFSASMAAFVSQNAGAKRYDRAREALYYGVGVSTIFGIAMFFLSFFHGDLLVSIFTGDAEVVANGFSYLKAYGVDCLLTCFLFCSIGYFNGLGMTRFVMIQGLVGAFLVRIPVSLFVSQQPWATLFHIGLATPCSTFVQILLCLVAFRWGRKTS